VGGLKIIILTCKDKVFLPTSFTKEVEPFGWSIEK
jgi:hypothetical protein